MPNVGLVYTSESGQSCKSNCEASRQMPTLLTEQENATGMPQFEFSLVIAGLDPNDDAFEDQLYDAGCDDALVSVVKGSVVIDFTRTAKNFVHAVGSAIQDVREAGARVIRVEPDNYTNLSDIAERTDLTRQAISLLIQGKRGPGDFPPPVARISTETPLWDWHSVARWFLHNNRLKDPKIVVHAALTRHLNVILEARREPLPGAKILERLIANARPDPATTRSVRLNP